MAKERPTNRLFVDFEASMVMGEGIVTDLNGLVATCPTLEDAIAMVAEANGETIEQVEECIRMEYLNNVRRGRTRRNPES